MENYSLGDQVSFTVTDNIENVSFSVTDTTENYDISLDVTDTVETITLIISDIGSSGGGIGTLSFPENPTNGQVYVEGSFAYRYSFAGNLWEKEPLKATDGIEMLPDFTIREIPYRNLTPA